MIKFSNYSLCITLPKWVITKLDWHKGDEVAVEIDAEGGKLIVSQNAKSKKEASEQNLRW